MQGALDPRYYPPPAYEPPPGYPVGPKRAIFADLLTNIGDVIAGRQPSSPHMNRMAEQHLMAQELRLLQDQARGERYEFRNVGDELVEIDNMTGAVRTVRSGGTDAPTPTANMRDFARRQELVEQFGADSEQVRIFDEYVRAGATVDVGGGGYTRFGIGGAQTPLVTPEAATTADTARERSVTSAREWSEADVGFEQGAGPLQQSLQGQIETLQRIEDDIRSGRLDDTGYFSGIFTPYLNEAEAELQSDAVMGTLNALQLVNLAPVTENELQLLSELFPSVRADPAANLGRIRAARRRLQRSLSELESQLDYFYDRGTLEGYAFRDRPAQQYRERRDAPPPAETDDDVFDIELPDGAVVIPGG